MEGKPPFPISGTSLLVYAEVEAFPVPEEILVNQASNPAMIAPTEFLSTTLQSTDSEF